SRAGHLTDFDESVDVGFRKQTPASQFLDHLRLDGMMGRTCVLRESRGHFQARRTRLKTECVDGPQYRERDTADDCERNDETGSLFFSVFIPSLTGCLIWLRRGLRRQHHLGKCEEEQYRKD